MKPTPKTSPNATPSAHGTVTVEVHSYGANAMRTSRGMTLYTEDGEQLLDEDVFADDDLPATPVATIHQCEGCGTRIRGGADCRMFDCPSNPDAVSAPLGADLESDRFAHVFQSSESRSSQSTASPHQVKEFSSEDAIISQVKEIHGEDMERLVAQTLELIASDGHTLMTVRQVEFFRRLLGHIDHITPTRTARHTTWSLSFEEEDGEATVHVSIPIEPGQPGVINVCRPVRHVDASGEFSQLAEDAEAVEEVMRAHGVDELSVSAARQTAEGMIARARAIKGGA